VLALHFQEQSDDGREMMTRRKKSIHHDTYMCRQMYSCICMHLYVCINMLYILPIESCILSYITRVLGAHRPARQDGARSIRLACFVPRICVCETWLIRMRDTTHSTWDMCSWNWSSFLRLVWRLRCVCTWVGDSLTWGTRHILLGKCQIDRV